MVQTAQNTELRQLENMVEVIGTLKSKTLEVKTSQKGNTYIGGELIVLVKDEDKVNEIKIKVMIMGTSKLFKGAETVIREYETIETAGVEGAHRVRISGELTLNEYYNSQGRLVQFNEIKGVFFNRIEDDSKDKATADIETIVNNFTDKMDADGLITGVKNVDAFSVAWGSKVVELRNLVVRDSLAEAMVGLYIPGSTGRLTMKINNYVETKEIEEEIQASPAHGFGTTETVERKIAKDYVNNLEIIGGDIPFFGTKEYTEEEIAQAKQVRALALQTLTPTASTVPDNAPTGFGTSANGTTAAAATTETTTASATPFSSSDLPDF